MPPATYKDDEDVTTTTNSINKAEGITGGKMEEPFDPLVQAKIAPTVKYTLADSDDEEEDTVETRRSVKSAEKYFNPEEEAAKEAAKKTAAVATDAAAAAAVADPAAAAAATTAAAAADETAQALDLPPELDPSAGGLMQVRHADYNHQFADIK